MLVFDTHCDTITTARERGLSLASGSTELSLDRPMGDSWCQCFAIWVDDCYRGSVAADYYTRHRRFFAEQLAAHSELSQQAVTVADIERITAAGRAAAVLTVENGAALGGSLDMVERLAADGVRAITLTWNAANELAGGQLSHDGFTDFGRAVVAAMEQWGIVADVSHLNETSFWQLERFARRPFFASHSNCRAVHDHPRNLTDDQIKAIVAQGGIVSLTYHQPFVTDCAEATLDDLCRHLDHLVTVGGEGAAALGSDFDGGKPPTWLSRSEQVAQLTERLTERFGSGLAARVAGGNALDFFRRSGV